MPLEAGGGAPYAPVATVLEVINRYRDRGLQTPFTVDVLTRAGVTDGLAPRTLQSLRLLDLINGEGQPTEEFERLRQAPTDEFPHRLEALIRMVYADVFQFADPSVDGPERVSDAFRQYSPAGQRGRMVTLFLGLCQEAGIVDTAPIRRRSTRASRSLPPNQRNAAERQVPKVKPPRFFGGGPTPGFVPAEGSIFGITERDIALLDEEEFAEVWDALGKVARARARGIKSPAEPSAGSDEGGGHYEMR